MLSKRCGSFSSVIALLMGLIATQVHAATSDDPSGRCKSIGPADFSQIQDAPTEIDATGVVAAQDSEPAYCRVQGYIWPQVGFELRLPLSNWNGKLIEIGCGGWCGHLGWTFWCPLRRGYACIVSDMGHKGGEEGLWAYNNAQAQIDFGFRATHVTALAGKAITTKFYEKPPSKSMMMGCSTGGYQGMVEAQRFPWDFDGIVSISPDMESQAMHVLRQAWLVRNVLGADQKPVFGKEELRLLHDAALAKCDLTDGVKDGIVGDPVGCQFDPGALECKGGQTTMCLTPAQVTAARNVYSGPRTSRGAPISSRGPFAGSELRWNGFEQGWAKQEPEDFFRYMFPFGAAGPHWTIEDLDFDHDYQRLGLASTYADNNPDLRQFKRAGGKLILALGGNEVAEEPGAAIDYYETVERTMGGRPSTQEFFRLFVVPGMDHCSGGDGAFAIDYLSALEAWVDSGEKPGRLVGAHVDQSYLLQKARESQETSSTEDPDWLTWGPALQLKFPLDATVPITFTRPVYPYPLHVTYIGHGDANKAENFKPVGP